jgi:hypothetical protein
MTNPMISVRPDLQAEVDYRRERLTRDFQLGGGRVPRNPGERSGRRLGRRRHHAQ